MSTDTAVAGEHLPRIRPPATEPAGLTPHACSTVNYARYGDFIIMYFNTAPEGMQGCMQISDPDWIALDVVQQMMAWMLFKERPAHIVQLGLGTATLTKFCYRHFPDARITAVELNPAVIDACRTVFQLPDDDQRLSVILTDAMDFVSDAGNAGQIDVLQVDLYSESLDGPTLDTAPFYAACARCLAPEGIMMVNLCGGPKIDAVQQRNLEAMRESFETIRCFRKCCGNIIAMAYKTTPSTDAMTLTERALCIERSTRLPASAWLQNMMPECTENHPNCNASPVHAT